MQFVSCTEADITKHSVIHGLSNFTYFYHREWCIPHLHLNCTCTMF